MGGDGEMMPNGTDLQILQDFLDEQDIPKSYYSIGKYSDEAVCIENTKDGWIVYEGDRGNHYNETKHDDFCEAACQMLSLVAESDSHERRLQVVFRNIYESRRHMDPAKFASNLSSIQNSSKLLVDPDEINYERNKLFEYFIPVPYHSSDYLTQIHNTQDGFYNHFGDNVSGDKIIEEHLWNPLMKLDVKLHINCSDPTPEESLECLCTVWKAYSSSFSRGILLEIKPLIDILPTEYFNDTLKEIREACESAARETGTGMSDDDGNCDPPDDAFPSESDS